MHITSMEEHLEESNSEVNDSDGDTDRFMSLSNRAGGDANDASLLEDEDYDIYEGYQNDAYDISDEQLTFYNSFDIRLCGALVCLYLGGMKNNHKKKKGNSDGSTAMPLMAKEGAGVEFTLTLKGSSSKRDAYVVIPDCVEADFRSNLRWEDHATIVDDNNLMLVDAEYVRTGLEKQYAPISFVTLVRNDSSKHVSNFCTLDTGTKIEDTIEMLIPLSSILEANAR
ncbi:hypothetical protein Tco_1127168 [Tanacetum coccineum]